VAEKFNQTLADGRFHIRLLFPSEHTEVVTGLHARNLNYLDSRVCLFKIKVQRRN
jgi:hypothetical protein